MIAPSSTYRLQIRPGFTLDDAAAVVPYLARLGVGAVYCSPVLTAMEGSDHGYDTVDPTTVDPARGGEEGWTRFVAACREHGLGIIVDIVPNHMGVRIPRHNPAWWSVLSLGKDSPYAGWFDVDWERAPVVVPILGSADDVEAVQLDASGEEPVLRYHDHVLPLAPGSWHEGDPVADVLARQHYRLADWRTSNTDLNYRRFFAIVDLAGVRVDDPAVFDATHARVLRWIADGDIDGLRIDHPDGLRDPGAYLARLREAMPDGWIVTEKIPVAGETLPDWAHDGTVGYEALREVTSLLVASTTTEEWTRMWREIGAGEGTFAEAEARGKAEMVHTQLVAEARRLAALVQVELAAGREVAHEVGADPEAVAAPDPRVMEALQEIAAHFEVYRTYLPFGVEHLDEALAAARAARPDLADVLDRVSPLLHDADREVAQRFQQLTGPVLAKGVEDTALYRWNRLLALNEVGGAPGLETGSVAGFHEAMTRRQALFPRAMSALSTHDTKRAEDVRAALLALAEWPEVFEPFARLVRERLGRSLAGFAFGLAQTLVAGPADAGRVQAWATKALREAGEVTSWTEPDADVEGRVAAFVAAVLDGSDADAAAALARVRDAIADDVATTVLAQKAVQLMMPGVPDVYQGTEVVDDSLVDPDNRRPVDFAALAASLPQGAVAGTAPAASLPSAKQALTRAVLTLRRDCPELFGGYEPLAVHGAAEEHVVAFDRGGAVCVATRMPRGLREGGGWGDTTLDLPPGSWRNLLTGATLSSDGPVPLADVLRTQPVAVLVRA